MTPCPKVDSRRLCGAADLLLEAIASQDGMDTAVPVYFDVPSSVKTQRYTLLELVDAMSMLMRLGLVPARKGAYGVGRDVCPLIHPREERRIEVDGESRRLGLSAGSPCARTHGPRTSPRGAEPPPRPDRWSAIVDRRDGFGH
jgi:hypothetical protein